MIIADTFYTGREVHKKANVPKRGTLDWMQLESSRQQRGTAIRSTRCLRSVGRSVSFCNYIDAAFKLSIHAFIFCLSVQRNITVVTDVFFKQVLIVVCVGSQKWAFWRNCARSSLDFNDCVEFPIVVHHFGRIEREEVQKTKMHLASDK